MRMMVEAMFSGYFGVIEFHYEMKPSGEVIRWFIYRSVSNCSLKSLEEKVSLSADRVWDKA
jgi:hypothetical protein